MEYIKELKKFEGTEKGFSFQRRKSHFYGSLSTGIPAVSCWIWWTGTLKCWYLSKISCWRWCPGNLMCPQCSPPCDEWKLWDLTENVRSKQPKSPKMNLGEISQDWITSAVHYNALLLTPSNVVVNSCDHS